VILVDVARVIAPDHHNKHAWADDPANLAQLIRWLDCKGLTHRWEADHYAYLLEKAHKWQGEWDEMQAELAKADRDDYS
jgi:hypothetical protein